MKKPFLANLHKACISTPASGGLAWFGLSLSTSESQLQQIQEMLGQSQELKYITK